ncbi:hypothetical protein H9Y04_14335 [Streptomyces sp. TRM66268-LWL]|uniref:Uncharacterized protein n=1 Tax=Streptomyces polyasparticus TaxID=2767826 RepID=A0ABR7SE22_9ACTN|nr:hypothetical protein [Streptomyces polyasparticus]MBC9713746.1 hypothetical protein [Streptomyces polyasparticus]
MTTQKPRRRWPLGWGAPHLQGAKSGQSSAEEQELTLKARAARLAAAMR